MLKLRTENGAFAHRTYVRCEARRFDACNVEDNPLVANTLLEDHLVDSQPETVPEKSNPRYSRYLEVAREAGRS